MPSHCMRAWASWPPLFLRNIAIQLITQKRPLSIDKNERFMDFYNSAAFCTGNYFKIIHKSQKFWLTL